MDQSQSHHNALPVSVMHSCETRDEKLLNYIASCGNWRIKLAPAYTLYVLARDRSSLRNYNLKQFLTDISIAIYRQIEKPEVTTSQVILWLANASELFAFFKYDQQLVDYSQDALDILENSIKTSFSRLLDVVMHYFDNYTKKCDFDVKKMLQKICILMDECMVNVGLINQFYSYLLQWVGGNLIENIVDNLGPYEKYFVNIRTWATTMDDQYLMTLAEKYEDLLEKRKHKQQASKKVSSDPVRLGWKKPLFLEKACSTGYMRLIEEGSKMLSHTINDRNIALNKTFAPQKLYLPENAFAYHYIEGVPGWLANFLNSIQDKQFCYFNHQKESYRWNVFLKGSSLMVTKVDVRFIIPTCPDRKQKFGGIYIVWYDLNDPTFTNLNVGDMLFSINDKLLVDILQKDAEKIIKNNIGKVKIEILKNDFIWIVPKGGSTASPVVQTEASSSSKERDEDKPSKPATPPPKDLSEKEDKLQKEKITFISEIRKKVEDLNNMLDTFDGISDSDRNYVYMKEIMIRGIIKLDNMETTTNEEIMKIRRETIYFIQQKTQQLLAKLKENQEIVESKILEENSKQHQQNDDGIPQPEANKSSESTTKNTQSSDDVPISESSKSAQRIDSKDMHPLKQSAHESTEKEQMKNTSESTPKEIPHVGTQTPENFPLKVSKKKILVFETRYNLDDFGSTYLSIGIYPHAKSGRNQLVVKLSNTEGHSVIFEYVDWQFFLNFQHLFQFHFQSDRETAVHNFNDYFLRFETENSTKFITLLCDTDFINLSEDNINNILKLVHLIEMRFRVIANFCFDDYFTYIISKSLNLEGSTISNIYILVNHDIEKCNSLPCAYAMMEIIQFYPEILIENASSRL